MDVIRRRRSSCAIGHTKFGPSLRETSPSMSPQHMVDDEGSSGFFSGRDGMQVVGVFVSWSGEGPRDIGDKPPMAGLDR